MLHTALSCCHRQISDFLVCYCSTHWGKMSLLAGVWVPDQLDRKEKWYLHWDDKVESKMGRHTMEKLSLTQHLGKSHPFHLPIYTIPQLPSSLPPPQPPTPFISKHGRALWLLARCPFPGLRVGANCFASVTCMLVLGALPKLLSHAFWILCWALETHWNRNVWCKDSGKSQRWFSSKQRFHLPHLGTLLRG